MYTILIIDDDLATKEILEKSLTKLQLKICIITATTILEVTSSIIKSNIDLFVFNIPTNDDSFINTIKSLQINTFYMFHPFVFVSYNTNNLVKYFKECYCMDYIMKPLTEKSFQKTVAFIENFQKLYIQKPISQSIKSIAVSTTFGYSKIPINQIIFIEYLDRKCSIHTYYDIITTHCSMKKAVDSLDGTSLIQSHRSFIININFIQNIKKCEEPYMVFFYNYDKYALLSRGFKKDVVDKLNKHTDIKL